MCTSRSVFLPVLAGAVAAMVAAQAFAGHPSAEEIVAATDKVRNPQQAFRVSLALLEYVNGSARNKVELAVHSKYYAESRRFKNLVRYVAPPRDTGKLVLLNGSNMWFYDPTSKASVRISPQQRLTGQASDGDVVSVNLAMDYTPKLVGEETIADADHRDVVVWHLDLAASGVEAMYSRLEYWIEKGTYRPIKAKFYSDSGRVLKIAYFRKYEQQLGGVRSTQTIIIDAVDSHLVTTMTYAGFHAEEAQDAWFQRDHLPRFKEE